jgi:cytochrome b subunit of formate dehydrogenase
MKRCAKTTYGLMALAGIVLAATGIGTFALGSPPMTHWMLMAHVATAPLFALGIAGVALTWSRYCAHGADSGLTTAAKGLLWVILMCGLIVMLSGIVPMTPVFGTRGQHLLYLTHRYAGIVLALAVLAHAPMVFRSRARNVD